MAKILVTGATGFVGRNLVPVLEKLEHELILVNSKSGDIVDNLFWASQPAADVVIHLAASTYVPDSWNAPVDFMKTNFLGTLCALDYCKNHNAKLVFLSSYLYGNPNSLPIKETATLSATNPYALSKKMAEEACAFYAEKYNVSVIILRPFNIYGPGQGDNFLIPTIIRQLFKSNMVQVKDLQPKRDYIYINDLVNAIILTLTANVKFGIYNIGSGISYSVMDIIQKLQCLLKTDLPVVSSFENRPGEIMDTRADYTQATTDLSWKPNWSFDEGLTQILALYKIEMAND